MRRRSALFLVAAMTAMGLGGVSEATASPSVAVAPSRIASDCSRDVSASLSAWLKELPDGTTARLAPKGCYLVQRQVLLSGKRRFTLDGKGSVLRRTEYTPLKLRYPHANPVLLLVDLRRSRIMNLKIRGTNTKTDLTHLGPNTGAYRQEVEFDHGVSAHGLRDVLLTRLRIHGVWGDGLYLSGNDQYAGPTRHVTISDVRVSRNGRQGIAINRSRHVLVDGVTIVLARRSGIVMEPDTTGETISDIEIRNSSITSNLVAVSAFGAGRVNRVYVHDNVIPYSGVPWLYNRSSMGLDRHDWTVTGNVVQAELGSPMPMMAFWNTQGVTIAANSMSIARSQSRLAVGLWDGSGDALIRCNGFKHGSPDFVSGTPQSFVASNNDLSSAVPPCRPSESRLRTSTVGAELPVVVGARL